MHIVLVAAENDALPRLKVGGLGDVIRDLPVALNRMGHKVTVITPSYGLYSKDNAQPGATLEVNFMGVRETLQAFKVPTTLSATDVDQLVLEHKLFSIAGIGKIYTQDSSEGPFATDATRFALFCAGVCELLLSLGEKKVDVIHCHDWHTGAFLILRQFAARYKALRDIPTVYSIHNLSMQGVRPFRQLPSSLESWFPQLNYETDLIADPNYDDCVNLMRAGVNLASRVHTVSKTYAKEILHPSNWSQGLVGGEGLEKDLQQVHADGRLIGILNGCDYDAPAAQKLTPGQLATLVESTLDTWATAPGADFRNFYTALRRCSTLDSTSRDNGPILVSIGRLTTQKLFLLVQEHKGESVMSTLLKRLNGGFFIMLGSGDPYYEEFFTRTMMEHENFLFLKGYSDTLSEALYSFGDLFIMPSIYEPCGISQMLAMRAGVPCLVHRVGGLNDTITHGVNGFSFGGSSLAAKISELELCFTAVINCYLHKSDQFQKIATAAGNTHYTWEYAIAQYLQLLYVED